MRKFYRDNQEVSTESILREVLQAAVDAGVNPSEVTSPVTSMVLAALDGDAAIGGNAE